MFMMMTMLVNAMMMMKIMAMITLMIMVVVILNLQSMDELDADNFLLTSEGRSEMIQIENKFHSR